jgi:superfamily II DNA/RNA helicase
MSKQSFADLGVSGAVCRALSRRGITAPFPVQRLVLKDVLAGRDVLVKSPTGSGKTLAFGIPLAERLDVGPAPTALVLAPTRELAAQIVAELDGLAGAKDLRVAAVYGGVGITAQAARAKRAHIIVATPGRLEDLLARRAFSLDRVRMLVLDEADRMLDMGFRPAIDRIVAACPKARQTLFFSATLDGVAGDVASRYTSNAIVHEQSAPPRDEPLVEHRFIAIRDERRVEALVQELENERDRAIVFVRTKRGADRLVKRLDAKGVEAVAIHGNKSQGQRDRALSCFQSGRVDTLVATDVAARGIDVEGVSHVINFDPPGDHETYIHRVGRTGRAGNQGVGVTLVGVGERHEMRQIARRLGLSDELGGEDRGAERSGRGVGSEKRRAEQPGRRVVGEKRRAERPGRRVVGEERGSGRSGRRVVGEERGAEQPGRRAVAEERGSGRSGRRVVGEDRGAEQPGRRAVGEDRGAERSGRRVGGEERRAEQPARRPRRQSRRRPRAAAR